MSVGYLGQKGASLQLVWDGVGQLHLPQKFKPVKKSLLQFAVPRQFSLVLF